MWQFEAPGSWFRPREVKLDEHYTVSSEVLMQLVRKGLVERSQLGQNVGYLGWSYRLTFDGCSRAVGLRHTLGLTKAPYEDHAASDLSDLGLSVRAYNLLRRSGYRTVSQLRSATMDDLSSIRGLGVGIAAQIFQALK